VDGQGLADVRQVGRALDRLADGLDFEPSPVPAPDRVDERKLARVAVLAEQMDLVAEADEGGGQRRVVDVAAGAAQQVAMEDEDPHRNGDCAGMPGTPDSFIRRAA